MNEFFEWLSKNPPASTAIIGSIVLLVISIVLIYIVAFHQGRDISFWPPRIGTRPIRYEMGEVVSFKDRSRISRNFAKSTLRSIDIFAGDIRTWLESDMPTYAELRRRGVRVRILVDEPNPSAIEAGKAHGILFRRYPDRMGAPLKGSITDTEDETECRALIVRRRTPRTDLGKSDRYDYMMKAYHGATDFPVIKGMAVLFDELFSRGEEL